MYTALGHTCQQGWDMKNSIVLFDKYKQRLNIESDNAAALKLGVSRQCTSKWRNGEAHPDAESVAAMCDATGENLAHWLPLIEADRARNPEARKVWLRLAQTAAIALVAWSITPSTTKAYESGLQIGERASQSPTVIHYAQFDPELCRITAATASASSTAV